MDTPRGGPFLCPAAGVGGLLGALLRTSGGLWVPIGGLFFRFYVNLGTPVAKIGTQNPKSCNFSNLVNQLAYTKGPQRPPEGGNAPP